MKRPISTDELPLSELIQFAAENRLTAALELRSSMAAGRIAIRDGEVIDAVFGGLEGETAIHAAMASRSLSVFRGRPPKASAARRVFASVHDLIATVVPRKSSPRASLGKLNLDLPDTEHPELHAVSTGAAQRNEPSRPSQVHRLGVVLLLGIAAAITVASWSHWGEAGERSKLSMSQQVAADREQSGVRIPARLLATGQPSCPVADCPLNTVPVLVLVDELGGAVGAKVENTRPEFQAIEDAAIRYALSARYQPATVAGHPVTSWIELPVRLVANGSAG